MRTTRIDVEGDSGATASIQRKNGSALIEVTISTPRCGRFGVHNRIRHLTVSATDRDEQFKVAEDVQKTLDGCRGTNSMIHDYFRLLETMAD